MTTSHELRQENYMPEATNEEDVKFYMTVDPELKRRFRAACGAASMTQVTQHLWRIFINSAGADKYEIIQEAARYE